MTDQNPSAPIVPDEAPPAPEEATSGGNTPASPSKRVLIAIVVAVFLVLLIWKAVADEATPGAGEASITSVRNEAVRDYEAAVESGKPIYVLFHSLTCVPCVEISEVADTVVPSYGEEISFVNVITDDPSGQELSQRFSFQYIPTSFFLAPGGEVIDSYTGSMTESEMRARLDALAQ